MPRLTRACLLLLAAACLPALPSAAAEQFTPAQRAEIVAIVRQALKQDPSILRDAVAALQADDAAHAAAESQAVLSAHRDMLVTPADPTAGNPRGAVTIVEFFDTRCPYCRSMEPTMQKLLAEDHEVKLVYKDLPILGSASVLGSKALLAAERQGGYDKLREAVMQMPSDTTLPMIQAAAEKLGLNWSKLQHDMQSPAIQQQIDANLKLAQALDIDGTPALVIGNQIVPGALDLADLQKEVAAAQETAKR
ncbi:MAG TPA: DsbA family protein [Acetobacteraceae bacterium]|nr:DsbA family protein [Acetobacteraceae bacterium]